MLFHQHYKCGKTPFIIWHQKTQTINYFYQWQLKLEGFIIAFRAGKLYLYSINRNVGRFHPCTTIERPCAGSKKLESLILAVWAGRFNSCSIHKHYIGKFYPCIAIENYNLTPIQLMSNCSKSNWTWNCPHLKKVILPCKTCIFRSYGSNIEG